MNEICGASNTEVTGNVAERRNQILFVLETLFGAHL